MPRKKENIISLPLKFLSGRRTLYHNYPCCLSIKKKKTKILNFVTKCRDEPFLRCQSEETTQMYVLFSLIIPEPQAARYRGFFRGV